MSQGRCPEGVVVLGGCCLRGSYPRGAIVLRGSCPREILAKVVGPGVAVPGVVVLELPTTGS